VAAPTAPAVLGRGEYSIARQLGLGVARIVVDAGHGGHDPGAQANGLTEADLVLDIALRLERLLQQQPGVEVVLTRRTDEFIPLEKRTAIANRENADLFLSIHANSARSTSLRGVETYFLNFAMTPDAEAVAARENATSAQTMGTLPVLLNKIALNNKLDESRELAAIMQTSLVRRLGQQNRNLRDLGVKQAPFVVLIGAQMPSVLSEISFVSNKSEAALLKQAAYRQHIAQALCDAVLKYQSSLKKWRPAAVSPMQTRPQGCVRGHGDPRARKRSRLVT
jgi:N-acetylmuramoyl-L-alanine amidase